MTPFLPAGGASTLVLTFDQAVSVGGAAAAVTEGVGAISGIPVATGNTVTVALSGVADRQAVAVTLTGVTPAGGGTASDVTVSFARLAGDLNQDGAVNAADITPIRQFYGQYANATNFTADANGDGVINAADVTTIQNNYGTVVLSFEQTWDFAYTGHFYHRRSALELTLYRGYTADLGRWQSRDPIESVTGKMAEMLPEGPNLYSYVGNNPLNGTDLLGLRGNLGIKCPCGQHKELYWDDGKAGSAAGEMTGGFAGGAGLFGAGLVRSLTPAATAWGGISLYVGALAGWTYHCVPD
ncbi:MAG: dockerin type I domain-containing protein [Terrimicrobiaceae bacterium]|nr:dockerin type I domain-containing protein [Terrimicrobiaceae bacterium]